MASLILLLALLAAAAAGVLFYLDARQRRSAQLEDQAPEQELTEEAEDSEEVAEEPEAAEDPEELDEIEAEVVEDEDDLEPDEELEPAPEPEPEPEAEAEAEAEPEVRRATAHRSSGLQFPGSTRRERRAWAEEKGYEFTRQDEFLIDEWSRGAAATGAPARDIVSGWAYHHEMLLMDLDGVNVMAMRTGGGSDVVADFRRDLVTTTGMDSADLVEVEQVVDFTAFGTDAGAIQRLIDVRVSTALELMPKPVTAVWMESDWVLAQTTRGTRSEDWEAMLAPLALLADAARVLPPPANQARPLPLADFTPTREMMAPPAPEFDPPTRDENEHREQLEVPMVLRPDEPMELPSRTQPRARGVVEPRAVGGDEVSAIADGSPATPSGDDTRVLRRPDQRPTIFDDSPAEESPDSPAD